PNYFLIVWDFVRYAREQDVPATARGSGVGALVCYALYLSHVCPIKYDLLFERFLDLNRKEAPDIDIDFCKDRRGEIIRYVKEKYGEENVAQIGTFGTLAAKAAITDVGRVLGWPVPRVNALKALVPEQLHISLDEAAGLLKMDFLGLRNLTSLTKAVDFVEQTTGQRVDPYKFPLDDKQTFALLQRGETKGIFQLESGGIRDLLQKMKPDHFSDII